VRVEAYRLGERAVELLLGAIRSDEGMPATHEVLPTELVVRGSSGASHRDLPAPGPDGRASP
jgi:DNA-binding LacI/PurR family transcriptional regulator